MKSNDNIEKLFKETFDHFEADVNPQIWTNVQSGINAAQGSVATGAAKFAVGKIVAGVASAVLISGSIWYFSIPDKNDATPSDMSEKQHQQPENVSKEGTAPVIIAKQKPSEKVLNTNSSTGWQNPPAARTLNHYTSDNYTPQTKIGSGSNDHPVYSDVSTLDHYTTNTSQPAHKYGNATQGDGGMMRGNPGVVTSSPNVNSSAAPEETGIDAPPAVIFVNTTSGDAPLSVNFINQGIASSLSWDFDDGTTSRESAPSHTFSKPGTYVVKLTAKNSSGTASDKISIEVKAVSSITDIPNIFTPNGDGENDNFFFEMKNIASIGVAIYSQEGKQIHTWNSMDGKWDGKLMNGQEAPEGVYLYSIQAIGSDGLTHPKRGFITLVRKR